MAIVPVTLLLNLKRHLPIWIFSPKLFSTVKIQKTYMRIAFYLPKNTKYVSHFRDLKLDAMLFYDKFTSLKMKDDPPWGLFLLSILANFLLIFPTSVFDLKVSALTWSHVFYTAQNV